jgi:hypothetical protein
LFIKKNWSFVLKLSLVFITVILVFNVYIFAQQVESKAARDLLDVDIKLPVSFPPGQYTPHGYIDNPHHSMVLNRSGVIRSYPPLGFGFWNREFRGSYAEGPRGHMNYISLLQMSVHLDGISLVTTKDFEEQGIDLYSAYHSKHLMSYDWTIRKVQFSLKYFLADENALICLVSIKNLTETEKEITLHATNIYGDWILKWWGSNGLSQEFLEHENVSAIKIWAYGDVFVMGSDWDHLAVKATGSRETWEEWVRKNNLNSQMASSLKGKGPLYTVHSLQIKVPPEEERSGMIYLCRGKNEDWTMDTYHRIREEVLIILQEQLELDETFWANCPKLAGDWPQNWQYGWVYDWETLRMNVRPPIGIFKHPWDAMQVHSPRLVLGETALDMFTLSHADPQLAKEVIYGTFADAIAPNVPCVREDGSVNMIGADGSECGTAPMWGFPYHVIRSIYEATGDTAWIQDLYPHLKSYVHWWLANRTDEEGWFHCNNSWESGQDGSRRFLVEGEGDPATFVRTVDVEASMAESMHNMAYFAGIAGIPGDVSYWNDMARERIRHTRSMFVDGWFRDIDGRNGQPIIFEDFYDPIMLAPLTCNVATTKQIQEIKPKISYIGENLRWLQWPPGVMAFTEAAWIAEDQASAARAIRKIADRVYTRTDSREIMFADENDPFAYRIPGIANEFWPLKDRPPGSENYGWGAILPLFIIRNIVGFRENDEKSFFLAPQLPDDYRHAGRSYGIQNLKYRDVRFNLIYEIQKEGLIGVSLAVQSPVKTSIEILNTSGDLLKKVTAIREKILIEFEALNGHRYLVRLLKE